MHKNLTARLEGMKNLEKYNSVWDHLIKIGFKEELLGGRGGARERTVASA